MEPTEGEPTSAGSLIEACKAGDVERVRKLCNPDRVRMRDPHSGWSALTWASAKGHDAVVKVLLERGAMEAELDVLGEAAPKEHVDSGDSGSVPVSNSTSVTSPLHWAAYKGHAGVVWTLLLHGMSPLQLDSENNTPLHLAAAGGHLLLVKTLLSVSTVVDEVETPVAVKARNIYGNSAMQVTKCEDCKKLLQDAAEAAVSGRPFLCSCCGEFVTASGSIPASVIDRVSAPHVRPVRYSKECAMKITEAEDALESQIKALSDPEALEAALEAAESIGAAAPLLDNAKAALLRLQAQLALQDCMTEVNEKRPLSSRMQLKPLMVPLKQCRERSVLPALVEQGDKLVRAVEAEIALNECIESSEAFKMADEHVVTGENGMEVIQPTHPFAVQADAHIAKLDGLIAAAQVAEALDSVIQAGEAMLRRLTGESEIRKALDEPKETDEPSAANDGESVPTTVWVHATGQKTYTLLEKLQLQTSSLEAAIQTCDEEETVAAVLQAARAKGATLQQALQIETAADEERKAKEAAAAAKAAKKGKKKG